MQPERQKTTGPGDKDVLLRSKAWPRKQWIGLGVAVIVAMLITVAIVVSVVQFGMLILRRKGDTTLSEFTTPDHASTSNFTTTTPNQVESTDSPNTVPTNPGDRTTDTISMTPNQVATAFRTTDGSLLNNVTAIPDVTACDANLCRHNGTACIDGLSGYRCLCLDGYEGDNCQQDVSECDPNLCRHNGTACIDGLSGYRCLCLDGYEGDNCQKVCIGSLSIENCPADFIHQEPAYCGTVAVNWTEPSATHDCGEVIEVQRSHEPGANLSVGTTTVTYTFTNSQNEKTCQFDVRVSTIRIDDDHLPPIIVDCPEHIYEVLEPGQTTDTIWWTPPTAIDGTVLPVSLTHQTHSPGDTFAVGGYELVNYTFADVAGNEAFCEFAVTLYPSGPMIPFDTTPPVIPRGCNPDQDKSFKVYVPAGNTSVQYEVLPLEPATDNDGQIPTVTYITYPPGVYVLPLGLHMLDAYYYDSSGNRARCFRLVHVRYGKEPARTSFQNCPPNIHLEIPAGTTTRVCWAEPELTDIAGNPVSTTTMTYDGVYWQNPEGVYWQSHQPADEFAIDGCYEQLVQYRFWDHYGNQLGCYFIVSVRAIGQDDLPGEWSRWQNFDNPRWNCDCENNHNIAATCPSGQPVDAQCETLSGQDWRGVRQVAYCCTLGLECRSSWNDQQDCDDYQVRYKCPLP